MEADHKSAQIAVNPAVPRLGIRINPEEALHFPVRAAQDHIEGLELALRDVAIPRPGWIPWTA